MARLFKPLPPLSGEQSSASAHDQLAFVSASAGTGKTQVLTARVIRLLLHGVDPSAILCLTFTKAGAAEMADRIQERLAHWVRLKDAPLAAELKSLGEHFDQAAVDEARKLFAHVLDAPGGGLRIQTIHAFAQSLLAAFPAEAGIVPGFHPLEGREEALLARETLATMLVDAEERGDGALVADVQALSRRLGEGEAENFLLRCGRAVEGMAGLGPPELIGDALRRWLDVPLGDVDAALAEMCDDSRFDCAALQRIIAANRAWGTAATGIPAAETGAAWLASDTPGRAAELQPLREIWLTKAGTMRVFSMKLIAADPDYAELAAALDEQVGAMIEMRIKVEFADFAAAALRAGQRFAQYYAAAKRRIGGLDFDDLIRLTRELLVEEGMGQWVRYKLDQGIDHILVDEAQDTNTNQWQIVAALASEFFAGDPDVPGETRLRTIFAVGDFKQAIFGFQGTNPRAFEAAQQAFENFARAAGRELRGLSLDKSYRSTPPILALVDSVMANLGHESIGLSGALRAHASGLKAEAGQVLLLPPVSVADAAGEEGDAEEGWAPSSTIVLAEKIAEQVRAWIDAPLWLEAAGRPLRPEDVLILVRSRGQLASLIVARLHKQGVPVAGVDRLRLAEPLGVQDLLAALRFGLQPHDDLNLAALLVSPLFGWSQDELYHLAHDRPGDLYAAMRADKAAHAETLAQLREILARADFVTPHQLLESLLSGPMDGRRKLLARLGEEARDPIDELLNAALQFEAENPPSLQHFIDWFDRGTTEVKRDPSAPLDAVRVMTVHGAKGLQAPLVLLADATFDPDLKRPSTIDVALGDAAPAPLPMPRKAEQFGPLADAVEARKRDEEEEHWRLLYVALTRAEERLVVTGALGARNAEGPPEKSWYAQVDTAMTALDAVEIEDDLWSIVRVYPGADGAVPRGKSPARRRSDTDLTEPGWLRRIAPDEERPPRPLAPSALGGDDVIHLPAGADLRIAAERGKLLHRLFERLPDVAPDDRRDAALRWLASRDLPDGLDAAELLTTALAIIEAPDHAAIFSPDALAEAPIAAVVDDVVISGAVDRLLVTDKRIDIIDFKTGREVPSDADDVPLAYLRQMAAYAAALAIVFPERAISASLLYTSAPRLIAIPQRLLDTHKPRFAQTQESLSVLG